MKVKPIPDGYHTVTPYLVVHDVAGLIDFMKTTFDAEETERMQRPDGSIMHAEARIGDSVVMMGEANEGNPPMPGMLYLYIEDCDEIYRRSLKAGAESLREPEDQFYGDRTAGVKDAFGNQWWFASRVEQVSAEEMERRAEALAQQG